MSMKRILAAVLFVPFALTGCAEKEETPGEKLDGALEDAGDKADEAAEALKD